MFKKLPLLSALASVYLIWGSTYLAIRFALETLPPFLIGGFRFQRRGEYEVSVYREH